MVFISIVPWKWRRRDTGGHLAASYIQQRHLRSLQELGTVSRRPGSCAFTQAPVLSHFLATPARSKFWEQNDLSICWYLPDQIHSKDLESSNDFLKFTLNF